MQALPRVRGSFFRHVEGSQAEARDDAPRLYAFAGIELVLENRAARSAAASSGFAAPTRKRGQ